MRAIRSWRGIASLCTQGSQGFFEGCGAVWSECYRGYEFCGGSVGYWALSNMRAVGSVRSVVSVRVELAVGSVRAVGAERAL